MHKQVVFLVLLMLFLLLKGTAFSSVKKLPAKINYDTSAVKARAFNANALKSYTRDKDFNYNTNNFDDGRPSFWTRFWRWLWRTLFSWMGSIPYGGSIMKYVLLALAIGLLVYVIFKSLGIDPGRLMRGEATKTEVPYTETLENIHEINFDAEIENAVSQHNYRLAVRLLYLGCLKQLSDNDIIKWQPNKTNTAYAGELKDPEQKQIFNMLTNRFEYVWYGNFSIDKQVFGNVNDLFQTFKKHLS
ncbi:MAG: DUF4129 domain-containing protein [Sphingobacteriales bacterium]